MLRDRCAGCGSRALEVFADLGETPLADVFAPTAEEAERLPRYRLRAALCGDCQLAQLLDVVDDHKLYGSHYGFKTGGSPSSLPYMETLARKAVARSPGRGIIVDIGCNDRTLMDCLIAEYHGRDIVLGVDPSAEPAADVFAMPFGADFPAIGDGRAGLVTAVNVAAHVRDPHDFLKGVRRILAPEGIAVVEFQYLPDLLAGCMFDLIYHEHRFFYTLDSFSYLARQHDLHVFSVQHTPAQGGSLRVWLSTKPGWEDWAGDRGCEEREQLTALAAGFQARADYAAIRIGDEVCGYPGTVYGYAASAKSCTLLNRCGLTRRELPLIVDATESKWGAWAPGTGIAIVGWEPNVKPDAYLVLASNYLTGILNRERERGFTGDLIVPLPLPVIV